MVGIEYYKRQERLIPEHILRFGCIELEEAKEWAKIHGVELSNSRNHCNSTRHRTGIQNLQSDLKR